MALEEDVKEKDLLELEKMLHETQTKDSQKRFKRNVFLMASLGLSMTSLKYYNDIGLSWVDLLPWIAITIHSGMNYFNSYKLDQTRAKLMDHWAQKYES